MLTFRKTFGDNVIITNGQFSIIINSKFFYLKKDLDKVRIINRLSNKTHWVLTYDSVREPHASNNNDLYNKLKEIIK